ncbi:MAG TPA: tetratricopeptide repeat protein, partial [Bacteroidales bacterium]|nr:tetratricopeptide repeat protein [Bacteroidales bacterium]
SIVGGDKEKAIEYYNKALRVIESDPERLRNNWIYVNTLIVLAQVYEKMGNNTYACSIYEKIMIYDPGIEWVKNDLYSGCSDTDSSFD